MHIREDDFLEAKVEIQGIMGWDDPIETLPTAVQIPNSQGHEVWVDEKRKRAEEHILKRYKMRAVKQKEEKVARGKEKAKPTFKL